MAVSYLCYVVYKSVPSAFYDVYEQVHIFYGTLTRWKSFTECRGSGSTNKDLRCQTARQRFVQGKRAAFFLYFEIFIFFFFAKFYVSSSLCLFHWEFCRSCNPDCITSRNLGRILNRHVKVIRIWVQIQSLGFCFDAVALIHLGSYKQTVHVPHRWLAHEL